MADPSLYQPVQPSAPADCQSSMADIPSPIAIPADGEASEVKTCLYQYFRDRLLFIQKKSRLNLIPLDKWKFLRPKPHILHLWYRNQHEYFHMLVCTHVTQHHCSLGPGPKVKNGRINK